MKKKLKIVLKKDVQNLGTFGEVKEVAAGFARNFLVPQGLAIYLKDPASKQILKTKEELEKAKEKKIEELNKIAKKLDGLVLTLKAKTTEKGGLFDSIGVEEVMKELAKSAKIKLNKNQIEMAPIKEIEESPQEVKAKLGHGIEVKFKIKIIKASKDEARRKK
jgi:large subunit ribosomal protein L9